MGTPKKQWSALRVGLVAFVAIAGTAAAFALFVILPYIRAEEARQAAALRRAIHETPNYGSDRALDRFVEEEDDVAVSAQEARDRAYLRYLSRFAGCLDAVPEEDRWICYPLPREEWERRLRTKTFGNPFPNHVHGVEEPIWPAPPTYRQQGTRRRPADADDPLVGLDSL